MPQDAHSDALRRFYEEDAHEELRLHPDSVQRLEYETALRFFDACLPANAHVLDNCAGTGAYAFALARRGHSVTAGDLVARNVDYMKAANAEAEAGHRLRAIYEGDALHMPQFADASFDAVLCMGALYHLHEEPQRRRAVREALRVLRPGGLFFASYMNRFGVIAGNLTPALADAGELLEFAQKGSHGVFYASTAGETEALMAAQGLAQRHHLALDGPAFFLSHTAGLLNEEGLQQFKTLHHALCEEPSLLGASYHNLYIGHKIPA